MSRLYHSIIEHTNQYSYTSSIFTKVMHIMAVYCFALSTYVTGQRRSICPLSSALYKTI